MDNRTVLFHVADTGSIAIGVAMMLTLPQAALRQLRAA
jgi:hypothetical protein